jgi:hypothetical protein
MTRNEVIAGSMVAVLTFAAVGELCFDKEAKPKQTAPGQAVAAAVEAAPASVEDAVSGLMSRLEGGSAEQRQAALASLLDQLESDAYAKETLAPELTEPLVKAAVAALSVSTESETPEAGPLRLRAALFVASRTHGETSKKFVLESLASGPLELRGEIARGVGRPEGVKGGDVFAAVKELGEKGEIPGDVLPGALRRLGGKKAVEPILAVLAKAERWKDVGACVTALQDYQDPALIGPALERLDQLKMLDNPKLPWMSPKLFNAYLDKAEGASLARGLRAAKTRPALVSLDAVKRGLESSDADTRRVAAEAVRKAVIKRVLQAKDGETLLTSRLARETEPVIKAELTGGLQQVRELMPEAEQVHQ